MRGGAMNTSRVAAIFLLVAVLLAPVLAEKKPPIPLATVNFFVLRDENGKPVRNAAVVLHPVEDNGKQSRGGIELKTDPDGKANYDGVPYGKMRIQVLASGFQTFGNDYAIGQPNLDITIKLKRPDKQYSIYEDHPNDKQQKDQKPQ
jgi:5-hydroxyisourate hydrolase-like protein (transthyretin family)